MVQEPTISSLHPRFLIESALERPFLPISKKKTRGEGEGLPFGSKRDRLGKKQFIQVTGTT